MKRGLNNEFLFDALEYHLKKERKNKESEDEEKIALLL